MGEQIRGWLKAGGQWLRRRPRADREAAGLTLGLFTVYALGACRTIYVGDSGELVTAVYLLGIPHPSGYPVYCLLGKLWTLLVPVGSIAFRMSLFSAAAAAGTGGLLYGLLRRRTGSWIAAGVGAGLLAFSPSFWSQANVQRVYSLNALFLVGVTLLVWRWHQDRKPGVLASAFFLCGLGAGNHTFMVVAAVAVGLYALVTDWTLLRRPREGLLPSLAFLPGLLPYAYLPLRSHADPRLDWGNPETLENFLKVIRREDFWERKWIEGITDFLPITGDYLRGLGEELLWVGAALAVAGGVALWRRRGPIWFVLLVMAGNFGSMALHGSRSDLFLWHRYYIPSYLMLALLAGVGAHALCAFVSGRGWGAMRVGVALLLLPLALLLLHWREMDRSRYRIAEAFTNTVLETLPPGGHLIATDDNILFVLIYRHLVEKARPDMNLILQGVGGADLPPLRFNPDTDPVYFTHHPNWNLPGLEVVPVGVLFKAHRAGQPPPEPVIPTWELPGENDPRVPKDYLTRNLVGHLHYMLGITHETRDWPTARREFTRATAIASENDVLFYNLGLIYRRNGQLEDALAAFRRSHQINPRHLASHSKPRARDRVAELEAERDRLARLEATLAGEPALAGLTPGSAPYHERMAELLAAQGETLAARGHRLRALELVAAG